MEQISFFSAEASGPELADLAGLLCGPGQLLGFGRTAARLSVPVAEQWRAHLLAGELARRGVEAGVGKQDGRPLVRTAFRIDLIGLARSWGSGPDKILPPGFRLTGAVLRLWALAAGRPADRGYLFEVDEQAPGTHVPLVDAFRRLGLGVRVGHPPGGRPVIRLTGRRRLAALGEFLGAPPPAAEPAWPQVADETGRPSTAGFGSRQPGRVRSRTLPGPTHATIW
ncbi:MAG TPA: hypothetical protein VFG87_00285 [Amycolatopsis sp.]|nr:hypothetical protein [Amycolatopsis sp.]